MKNKSLKVVCGVLLLLGVVVSETVFACSPSRGDNWFNYKITLDPNSLPGEVVVIVTDMIDQLSNKGSTPLYLLSESYEYFASTTVTELPQGKNPRFKLVNGEVYYWANAKWNIENGTGVPLYYVINLDSSDSAHTKGDNRPENTPVPEARDLSVMAYSGNNPVEIKGKMDYSLNNEYDPKQHAKGVQSCMFSQSPIILIGFLLIVIMIPVVIYKILKKFISKK